MLFRIRVLLLNITFSYSFISSYVSLSFSFFAKYFILWLYSNLTIHFFISGHLGCYSLALLWRKFMYKMFYTKHMSPFLLYLPETWIPRSYGSCLFMRSFWTVFKCSYDSALSLAMRVEISCFLFICLFLLLEKIRNTWPLVTGVLDQGNERFLTPSLVLGMCIPPTVPTVGTTFRDTALKDQNVVETICLVYMTELR